MRFYGYVIHTREQINLIIQRCREIALKYSLKFRKGQREDYSWKINGFERLHLSFYSLPSNLNFTDLLNLFREITLVDPTIISLEIEKTCRIGFDHYTSAEQFGSTKTEDIFAILCYEGNLNNIELTQCDLDFIKECNLRQTGDN